MRILLVENDPGIRAVVADVLTDEGHTVAAAPNGRAALALAAAQPPDLILLDMKMPIMDGPEFARRYRDLPPPHAPIYLLTAGRDAGQRAAEVGAAGFIGKPFDLGELVELVERHAA